MRFAAALTRKKGTEQAVEDLVASLRRQLPAPLDLLVVFLTVHHLDQVAMLSRRLREGLAPRVLIGCTCEGVIGGDKEVEREPAISTLAASLPQVTLTPFAIGDADWQEILSDRDAVRLRRLVGAVDAERESTRAFLTLADPFTTPIREVLTTLDTLAPGAPTVGGMASGAHQPGGNALLLNDAVFDSGMVGVRIGGKVRLSTVVSQGCRPIGETMLVTRAEGNLIETLGGQIALDAARDMLSRLSPEEQMMTQQGLYIGIVINEYQDSFDRGDFLIRNVYGADPNTGAIATDENIRVGQTVQFQVRDAESAHDDLRWMMAKAAEDEVMPAGGLVFSCNGRGTTLFERSHHDVRCVLDAVPETPLAGFFAMGELGPIGGRSFIHGHTASILLFRPE
jgi:small ligand-binding sensory domain FIST